MGKIFVWNFKDSLWFSIQNIWLIHWKMLSLLTSEILRAARFTSSCFWPRPLSDLFRFVFMWIFTVSYSHLGVNLNWNLGVNLTKTGAGVNLACILRLWVCVYFSIIISGWSDRAVVRCLLSSLMATCRLVIGACDDKVGNKALYQHGELGDEIF